MVNSCEIYDRSSDGFTLIELLITLSIIALLMAVAMPRYFNSIDKSKFSVLQQNLKVTRDTLDKYYADKGRYPDSLEHLVVEKYLRNVPLDPVTESDGTWVIIAPLPPVEGGVADIRSGAPGAAYNGVDYADL